MVSYALLTVPHALHAVLHKHLLHSVSHASTTYTMLHSSHLLPVTTSVINFLLLIFSMQCPIPLLQAVPYTSVIAVALVEYASVLQTVPHTKK